MVAMLEHPPVYTAGTSAALDELLEPMVRSGRGRARRRYTYHGPGQRIGYVLLDLSRRGRDVRRFVHGLEQWVIATLAGFGVDSWAVDGRVGIWTCDIDGREAKIGAIGVRVRRWVTMHGFSVTRDLSHFGGIVPCGIEEFGVTSLDRLGIALAPGEWDAALHAAGRLSRCPGPERLTDDPAVPLAHAGRSAGSPCGVRQGRAGRHAGRQAGRR